MFGEDLQGYILDNVNFESDKANQDIYFNIPDKRFWIHSYMDNESISPESEKNNILLFRIKDNMDWATWNGCQSCESEGRATCPYEECMSQALYEAISESDYVYNTLRPQILSKINPDIIPFIGITNKLSQHYDRTCEYLNKVFNAPLYGDIEDSITEKILSHGFREDGNDNKYLSDYIYNLKEEYLNQHDNLKHLFKLLDDFKVKDAAKYLNDIEATL